MGSHGKAEKSQPRIHPGGIREKAPCINIEKGSFNRVNIPQGRRE